MDHLSIFVHLYYSSSRLLREVWEITSPPLFPESHTHYHHTPVATASPPPHTTELPSSAATCLVPSSPTNDQLQPTGVTEYLFTKKDLNLKQPCRLHCLPPPAAVRVRQNKATKKQPWYAPSKVELTGIQPIFRTPITNNNGRRPRAGSHFVPRIHLPLFNTVAAAAACPQFPHDGNALLALSSADVHPHRINQQHWEGHIVQTCLGRSRSAGAQEEGPVGPGYHISCAGSGGAGSAAYPLPLCQPWRSGAGSCGTSVLVVVADGGQLCCRRGCGEVVDAGTDSLIINSGIFNPDPGCSAKGYNATLAVNILVSFIPTRMLLPCLNRGENTPIATSLSVCRLLTPSIASSA